MFFIEVIHVVVVVIHVDTYSTCTSRDAYDLIVKMKPERVCHHYYMKWVDIVQRIYINIGEDLKSSKDAAGYYTNKDVTGQILRR
jgi:hypothetical protein